MVKNVSLTYRSDIDGLRAIAVISVVLFHAFPNILKGGFIGVDVFFVISGFLISSILFENIENNRFNILNFYKKRILRIFPALIIVLLTCLVFGYFILFEDEYKNLGKHIAGGVSFISNIILWREAGYFDSSAEFKPLLHLWSLAIEEQFYIFWPCILFFTWKWRLKVWILIVSILCVSFVLNIIRIQHHAVTTFYLPMTRIWELLLGSLLAYNNYCSEAKKEGYFFYFLQKYLVIPWINNAKAFLGVTLITVALFTLSKENLFPSWWALLPTFGAFLLISSPDAWINNTFLSHKFVVWIGLISYPLYLWHWSLFSYSHIIFSGTLPTQVTFFLMALSLLLAFLTYQYVEKPIRFSEHSKYTSLILCLILMLIGCLGGYVYKEFGLVNRRVVVMQKNKLSEIAEFEAYKKNVFTCDKNIKNHQKLSWCFRSKKSLPTKVIWGDSHAEHLFPGIAEKDQEVNWLVIGQTGCPPLLGVEVFRKGNIDQCVKRNQFALDTILNLPSVDTVVLASLAPFYITNSGYAAGQTGENSPSHWNVRALRNESDELSKEDIFYAGMDLAITRLEAAGKDVILYQDVPEVPFVPAECLQRPLSPKPDKCKRPLSKEVIFKRQEVYRALFAKLKQAHPQIKIFDSTYYLCDEKSCYVRANKKFLYRDGHHLSMEGSRFLARPFLYWLNNERI